jgi:hypothetical protein
MSDTINAGFPPIKYCNKKDQSKERAFSSKMVDIKNILKEHITADAGLIELNNETNEPEIIDSL